MFLHWILPKVEFTSIATVVDGGEEDAEEHDISKSNGWSDVAVISCI